MSTVPESLAPNLAEPVEDSSESTCNVSCCEPVDDSSESTVNVDSCDDEPTADQIRPLIYSKSAARDYRNRMVERYPFCQFCGQPLKLKTATLEHIHPRAKGGTNAPSNLGVSCGPCNLVKRDRTVEEWAFDILHGAAPRIPPEWTWQPQPEPETPILPFINEGA